MQQIKDAIKSIQDYFNLDLRECDKKRLEYILGQIPAQQVITKTVTEYKTVTVHVNIPVIDFDPLEEECKSAIEIDNAIDLIKAKIAIMYGVPADRMFNGKCRKSEFVKARTHFIRYVRLRFPKISNVRLGEIIGSDHTVVHYYLYESKVDVSIPPLVKPKLKLALQDSTPTVKNYFSMAS